MPVKFQKSAYDKAEPKTDGIRIVATRFWPRGLKKEAADLYLPDLAPSADLLKTFLAGEMPWKTFAKLYKDEMKAQKSHIRTLHYLSETAGDTLTVMCACEKPEQCHRSLLAALIEKGG